MWNIVVSNRVRKQLAKLTDDIRDRFETLIKDIQIYGPIIPQWPHFSKLQGTNDYYHCHLKRGHPTYVAVWKVADQTIQLIEMRYIGTHEGINYDRIR
jgi:mRNA-degrading endonuclease RelE of RelBE toxin-antitoxin system